MDQLQTCRSLREIFDTSSSDSDSGLDEQNDTMDASREITFHVTSKWIERQGKLIDLGMRLSSNNEPNNVTKALQELDGLLEENLKGTETQRKHISLDIPEVGRAWFVEKTVRHCEEDNAGLHYQVLRDNEFTIFGNTIVFLSKYRGAIVSARLSPSLHST